MSDQENTQRKGIRHTDTRDVMPAETLPERQAALEWLAKVWEEDRQQCPICGDGNWSISDVANLPVRPRRIVDEANPAAFITDITAERVYPLVPISCVTCGYTFFINEKWIRSGGAPLPESD